MMASRKQYTRYNPVAKHAHKFNKTNKMDPKKLKEKRGHVKHKGKELEY